MFAVVEIAGTQFEVEENKQLVVPHLAGKPGDSVEFSNILAAHDEHATIIGTPYIDGRVDAKILEHGHDGTVLVFHKKRRKGHRKLNGHRAKYSKIEITNIKLQ